MPAPDRQPFRRPPSRPPSRRRPPPPPGPATTPPTVPATHRRRRDLLKVTYHRLARLARAPVAVLVAADTDRLLSIAAGVEPVDNGPGKARRLVMRVLRLRG